MKMYVFMLFKCIYIYLKHNALYALGGLLASYNANKYVTYRITLDRSYLAKRH